MRRRTVLQLPLVLGVTATSMAAVGRTALAQAPVDIHIATMSAEVWHNIRRTDGSWDGFAVLEPASQLTKRNMASAVVNGEEVLAYQSFNSPTAMKTYIQTRHEDGTWSREVLSSLDAGDTALAAVAGELHIVQRHFLSKDTIRHAIRRAGGDWTESTQVPIQPNSTGASLTGSGAECRLMVLGEDGKTMHPYVRSADGTWSSPDPITFEPPGGTVLTNVQIVQIGAQLHVIALTSGGLLFHETRGPDNIGSGFRNVYDQVGHPGDVAKFSATASGARLHIALITKSSELFHTIRSETGAWQRLGHLGKAPGTNPLPDVTIAGAGA